jgi:DNA-binding transcriptional regulator/RsmH inhibitor MraZ
MGKATFDDSFFGFTLDSKHRVSVPKPYRDAVEAVSGRDGIYMVITPNLSLACVPGTEAGARFREMTAEWGAQFGGDFAKFAIHARATAQVVAPDGNGRVVVPSILYKRAKLGGPVHWLGRHRYFELRDATRFDQEWEGLELGAEGMETTVDGVLAQAAPGTENGDDDAT